MSDLFLLDTAMIPLQNPKQLVMPSFIASLDHSLWFHKDLRADEWLLFEVLSDGAIYSKALVRSNIFN